MHPSHPVDHAVPTAPAASWVMGRSARWQTPEGQALLAQDPLLDDLRDLRQWSLALTVIPNLPVLLRTVWRAVGALHTAWALRRESREG